MTYTCSACNGSAYFDSGPEQTMYCDGCGQKERQCRCKTDDRYERLKAAVLDIDAHATQYGDSEGKWVRSYIIPTGPLHRAFGVIGHVSTRCIKPCGCDCHPKAEAVSGLANDQEKQS